MVDGYRSKDWLRMGIYFLAVGLLIYEINVYQSDIESLCNIQPIVDRGAITGPAEIYCPQPSDEQVYGSTCTDGVCRWT